MSNLPILHFTLGALVGLPVGYWIGYVCDPKKLIRVAYTWAFTISSMERDMKTLRESFVLNGIDPKVAA